VAHSTFIKADLQAQDRRRQLQEAKLGLLNARLDLAVLLFPDFNDKFEIGDDLHGNVALPPQPEFEAQAAQGNPDIRARAGGHASAVHEVNAAVRDISPRSPRLIFTELTRRNTR